MSNVVQPESILRWLGITSVLAVIAMFQCAWANDALLEYVEAKQAEAREKLKLLESSLKVTLFDRSTRGDKRNMQSRNLQVTELRQGDKRRIESTSVAQVSNEYGPEGFETGDSNWAGTGYLTINESEAAYWQELDGAPENYLQIWRHTSVAEMNRNAAGMLETLKGVDMVDHAFGVKTLFRNGSGDLGATREMLSRYGDFQAEEVTVGGEDMISVTYVRDGRLWMTAMVDPKKGYATTSLSFDGIDGDGNGQQFESAIAIEEIADGVWAPVTLEASSLIRQGEREFESSVTAEVSSQRIVKEADPAFFRWTSLNYPGESAFLIDEAGISYLKSIHGEDLKPAPLTREAEFTPEAVVNKIAGVIDTVESSAPEPFRESTLPLGGTMEPERSSTPTVVAIAFVIAIVLVGGIGIVAVRRS